jgi:hypothetical protein
MIACGRLHANPESVRGCVSCLDRCDIGTEACNACAATEKFLPCSACATGGVCDSCAETHGYTAGYFDCCEAVKDKALCDRCFFQCCWCEEEMCIRHRQPKLRKNRKHRQDICRACFDKAEAQDEIMSTQAGKKRRRVKK